MRLSDNMEVNASVVPLFTGGNWDEFEFKMRNLLEFKELWEAIEYDEDSEVSQAMKETEKEIMRKKNSKAKRVRIPKSQVYFKSLTSILRLRSWII
jgi:hypothetical protein